MFSTSVLWEFVIVRRVASDATDAIYATNAIYATDPDWFPAQLQYPCNCYRIIQCTRPFTQLNLSGWGQGHRLGAILTL